jgi:hypothetical protein
MVDVEAVPVTAAGPRLEGVLGPLAPEEEGHLRARILEVVDSDRNAIAFMLELRPGWYFGRPEDRASWVVELSVEADCLHAVDHEAMETVFNAEHVSYSARDAVAMFAVRARHLTELATTHPLEHWTDQTRD